MNLRVYESEVIDSGHINKIKKAERKIATH